MITSCVCPDAAKHELFRARRTALSRAAPARAHAVPRYAPVSVPETGSFAALTERALYRAADARALDACAIEGHGIPGIELMNRAGAAAWHTLRQRWPGAGRIGVICGPGNNGGDGFVVARLAREAGLEVEVFMLGERSAVRGDAALALAAMERHGVTPAPLEALDANAFPVLVDGLFGTGLVRPLEGAAAAAVAAINAAPARRLALDIPSGLGADTGRILGVAVRADVTVTFIGHKRGLFTGDARDCCGDLVLATLDVPEAAYREIPASAWRVDRDALGAPLGPRGRRAHKGRFGHVLVVGGEHGFAGAARLCAEACARSGAGLTSVATRPAHVAAIVGARPELMVRGVDGAPDLAALLRAASVVAVGPGLGRGEWGVELLGAALDSGKPRVLDADALNLMADGFSDWSLAGGPGCVITPHPGEAARLLGCDVATVESDRFAAVAALADATGAVALLKGAGTLVQAPARRPRVIDAGNPGMASGGMGDLLTGVIAALMAQGLEPLDAAVVGAVVHGAAADAVARHEGERGMLAGDLLPWVRRLVRTL